MDNKDFKNIDMTTKFSDFQVLNPDFTRCKCNVFYTGKNRNYTIITDEALHKLIERKGYANVPIVGHIKFNKNGKKIMGSHDRKLEITNDGIEEINECVAMGVVPLDANPRMEKIIDSHGIEREYFTVDVILWTHYFPELMETAYNDEIYFNHSMEIRMLDTDYEDMYTVINDFSLQALCMLGKYDNTHGDADDNSEPCFEDSRIRRFSVDENQFKQNFELMLEKLRQYEMGEEPVQNKETENNNPNTKGEFKMDLTKFTTLLSEIKYGDDCQKYSLLGANEENIYVADREDSKLYSVGYADTEDGVIINWDTKKEADITYTEKAENEENSTFSNILKDFEDDFNKKFEKEFDAKLETKVKEISDDAESRLSEMKEKYSDIQNSYAVAKEKLDKFEAIEAEKAKENHINAVKETLERFEKKIGKTPEFIYYKAKVDYEKVDIDAMEKELTLMTGDILMNKKDTNKTFSYNPTSTNVKTVTENETSSRYGNLLDEFMN